jgi:hypothetical protein
MCPRLGAFVCFVTSDNAARHRSQDSVMSGIMASNATYGSPLEATFGVRRLNGCQSKNNSRTSDKRLHFDLQILNTRVIRAADYRSVTW